MKKLFISQPMKGKSEEEITKEREKLVETAKAVLGDDIEVLDSFFKDFDGSRVAFLGKSIMLMSEADYVIFGEGWERFDGCAIEHAVCDRYGIPTMEARVVVRVVDDGRKWDCEVPAVTKPLPDAAV